MEDVIDYKIPFGIIGQIAHPIIVKNKLKQIFKYRENKLKELFGEIYINYEKKYLIYWRLIRNWTCYD